MSEDIEWITPPEDPDPGTYRGYMGVEKFWAQWREQVGELRFELEDLVDEGDHIVAYARRMGRGEHSGLEVSDRVIQVFVFEGEKCVRVREFYDRDKAMRWVRGDSTAESPAAEGG
jgi:ketosteroid isomerase-like protein